MPARTYRAGLSGWREDDIGRRSKLLRTPPPSNSLQHGAVAAREGSGPAAGASTPGRRHYLHTSPPASESEPRRAAATPPPPPRSACLTCPTYPPPNLPMVASRKGDPTQHASPVRLPPPPTHPPPAAAPAPPAPPRRPASKQWVATITSSAPEDGQEATKKLDLTVVDQGSGQRSAPAAVDAGWSVLWRAAGARGGGARGWCR